LAGGILLAVALAWIGGVLWTVPEVASTARVGARGFPLAMGVLLAGLALMLILASFTAAEQAVGESAARRFDRTELWALLATFGFLSGYVVLMAWFGFVIGTVVATATFLVVALKRRSPVLIGGISFGLALGVWFILGKLMGVYLPHGSVIDWF
jgi:hypothetical protein